MNTVHAQAIEELLRMVLAALGARDGAAWLFGSCARGEARHHSDLSSGFFGELEGDIRSADPALVDEVRPGRDQIAD